MPYDVSSRGYLQRARQRLSEGTPESLFYAAFELRAGIQARMQEYLHVHDHVPASRKSNWHLAQLSRSVQEAFRSGDKIAQLRFTDPVSGETIGVFYYTPVTDELRRLGEKLGDYLHAMQERRADDDPWWAAARTHLERTCRLLEIANRGTLFGPLLREGDATQTTMNVEFLSKEDGLAFRHRAEAGPVKVEINYLDEYPEGDAESEDQHHPEAPSARTESGN